VSQPSGSWELPLQFVRDEIPLVIVRISVNESQPMEFVLDTGNAAAAFVLSRRAADALKLPGDRTAAFRPASVVGARPVELRGATARSLAVGPFRFENVPIAISDSIDHLATAIGRQIDGNIGYPFLKDMRLTLDYRRHLLRFERLSGATVNSLHSTSFDLGSPKPLILIDAMVNGRGPFRFAVDTGAGSVVISTELSKRLNLQGGASIPMQGAGGAASGVMTQLSTLVFAGVSLRDVTVVAADIFGPLRRPVGGELDGIIGYNVMKDFTVTIDYPQKRITFER
jgi:predicted aspartyl protease